MEGGWLVGSVHGVGDSVLVTSLQHGLVAGAVGLSCECRIVQALPYSFGHALLLSFLVVAVYKCPHAMADSSRRFRHHSRLSCGVGGGSGGHRRCATRPSRGRNRFELLCRHTRSGGLSDAAAAGAGRTTVQGPAAVARGRRLGPGPRRRPCLRNARTHQSPCSFDPCNDNLTEPPPPLPSPLHHGCATAGSPDGRARHPRGTHDGVVRRGSRLGSGDGRHGRHDSDGGGGSAWRAAAAELKADSGGRFGWHLRRRQTRRWETAAAGPLAAAATVVADKAAIADCPAGMGTPGCASHPPRPARIASRCCCAVTKRVAKEGADGPTLPLATGDVGRAFRRADTVVDSGGFGVGDGECGGSGGRQHMRGRGRRNVAAPRRTGCRPPCALPLRRGDGGGGGGGSWGGGGTPKVVQVDAIKPTTQPKQLARARARPHSKSKHSPNQCIRDHSKAHANKSIRSARTKNVKSQKVHSKSHGYKCRKHQRSPNREEVAWVAYRRAYSGVQHDVPTRGWRVRRLGRSTTPRGWGRRHMPAPRRTGRPPPCALPLCRGDGGGGGDTVVDSGGFGVGDGECGGSGGWQHMRGRGRRNMAAPRRTGRRPPCALPLWGAYGGGGRVEAARLARPPLVRGVCCLPAATAGCWVSMGGDGGNARCRRRRKYAGRHEGGEAMPAARSEGVLGVTCEGGAFVVFGGRDAGGGGCGPICHSTPNRRPTLRQCATLHDRWPAPTCEKEYASVTKRNSNKKNGNLSATGLPLKHITNASQISGVEEPLMRQHGRTSHTPCLMTWHRKNSMGKKLKSIMKEAARHIRHVHTSGQSRYQRRVGHTVRHSAARHTRNDGYWREKRHTKERTRNRKSTDAPYNDRPDAQLRQALPTEVPALQVRQTTVDVAAGDGDDGDDEDDGTDDDDDSTDDDDDMVQKTLLRNRLPPPPTSSRLQRDTPPHKRPRARFTDEIGGYQSRNRDHLFKFFSFREALRGVNAECGSTFDEVELIRLRRNRRPPQMHESTDAHGSAAQLDHWPLLTNRSTARAAYRMPHGGTHRSWL
ncbi:hypothetical protein BU14_0443s0002 [Porphyra umbilicalis]|uniref:Uncharacterized protein n=1 Tax=Porphyra umbilicalis TaxID=2786 RepID=A0A1X6NUR4_PORUM|nr:hypothetical protein BU14_0443s0002 [Porphyra umbilicalis]|eukprot:OSX72358.1 hypothetical protein BU14_0443s0002 [Porphyra umbilicalis]